MDQNNRSVTYYVCVVFLLVAVATYYRIGIFQNLEPRMDHATMITWVKAVFQSQHFLPISHGSESWIKAFETDEESFLYAVLKPVYTAPTLLFNVVSLIWFSTTALITGPSLESQIAWSVIAHGCMLLVLALLPLEAIKWGEVTAPTAILISALTLLIALTSSYLHVFSPLGTHNVGLLTLLIAAVFISRYLQHFRTGQPGHAPLVGALIAQTAACYAMYTNVFLIPAATVFVLLLDGAHPLKRRYTEILRYSLLTVFSFIPAFILMTIGFIYPHSANDTGSFSGMFEWAFFSHQTGLFDYLTFNLDQWIELTTKSFSAVGAVMGVLGLILIARQLKLHFPLSLVLTHLLVWVAMTLFANSRNPAYILPFLSLGCGYLLVAVFQLTWRAHKPIHSILARSALVLVIFGFGWHFWTIAPAIVDNTKSELWGGYYAYQDIWRPTTQEIDARTQNDDLIVPWDDNMSMMYRSLSNHINFRNRVFRPLETLAKRQESKQLKHYIERRKLSIKSDANVYILAPATQPNTHLLSWANSTLCQSRLLVCDQLRLNEVESWDSQKYYGGKIVLYHLQK